MTNETFNILGIDIGGTKFAVCVGDSDGNIRSEGRMASGGERPYDEVLPELLELCEQVIGDAGLNKSDIRACGVCAPGPLDVPGGRMLKSPNMIWDDIPIRDDIRNGLDIPVYFDNDANGGGLAELYFGAGKGSKNLIYLTMSTGVGAGVVAEGKLVQGADGNAGEIGHLVLQVDGPECGCGLNGCFEAYCGGKRLAKRFREAMEAKPDSQVMEMEEVQGDYTKLDYIAIREGAKRGIPTCEKWWDEACLRLSQGIGCCMNTFNPEVIVLGTLALYSGDFLMDKINEYLPRFAWKQMIDSCEIKKSALGKQIGELAGVSVALYGLFEKGEWVPPFKAD